MTANYEIRLPRPHRKQLEFINNKAKRKVIRAGRRSGKTVGVSILAVKAFLGGRRILYATPTSEQIGRFWTTVTRALNEPIMNKIFYKNETEHIIELKGTEQRIKAKTAFNADMLRGDYADVLMLDEYQLINEQAWDNVGAPMLLDNDGDAVFIYTPPSLRSRSVSKATDPQHAAKMFKRAEELQKSGSTRWAAFHFNSMDNPHLSRIALDEITTDMSSLSYRMEILAEDISEAPGALWTRKMIDDNRIFLRPDLDKIVVGVDPSITTAGEECGIVGAGRRGDHAYLISDRSLQGSPLAWATAAVKLYNELEADLIIAEKNQGGEMVETTIHQVNPNVPVTLVYASRAKRTRAEPVSAKAEKGFIHHVGHYPLLEDELCVVGETLITCFNGLKPIKKIQKGELVLTRDGFKPVLWSGKTGIADKIISISTKNRRNLLTTAHHPVYHALRGFVVAESLQTNDKLEVNNLWHTKLGGMGTNMARLLWFMANDGLSPKMDITKIEKANYYIERFGKNITEKFRVVWSCIIKTVINSIMPYPILKYSTENGMLPTTQDIVGRLLKSRGSQSSAKKRGEKRNPRSSHAFIAAPNSKREQHSPFFATKSAGEDTIRSIEVIKKPTPVYNLKIAEKPEYYANGILVHNCLWVPGDPSPNRLDAMVWAMTDLMGLYAFDPLDLKKGLM